MDKNSILKQLDFVTFYKGLVPSIRKKGTIQAMGLCPFHNDKSPSMTVNTVTGTFHCFGCDAGGDVFTFYQRLKDVDFKTALKEIAVLAGVSEQAPKPVSTFQYTDINGNVLYIKERIEPGRHGRKKEFIFRHEKDGKWIPGRGHDPVPYNLQKLAPAYYTVIVEGEAKTDLLKTWEITATSLDSGAQSPWHDEYMQYFKDKKLVVILPDNDEPGRTYASRIANILDGNVEEIKIVNLPGLEEGEDIINWANKEGNYGIKLQEICKETPCWTPEKDIKIYVADNLNVSVKENEKEDQWPDPISFEHFKNLPEFPTSCLPTLGQKIVESITEVNQIDSKLPGSIYLAVLSTCLAKKGEVDLITHKEPLNLYLCSILGSGERKTSTVNILTSPLYKYQKEKENNMKARIAEALSKRKTDEANMISLQKNKPDTDKDKNNDNPQAKTDVLIPAKEIEETPIPKIPVFIADDITTEALGVVMAENNERLSIISTEGGIFSLMAGRYQEKQDGNFDIYLKAHAGDPWSSHRITRESKNIMSPALTIGLTVQHEVLKEVGKNKRFRGKGLLARFLYSLCSSMAGNRIRHNKMIPLSLLQEYNSHIKELMDIPIQTRTIKLTSESQELWDEFYNKTETDMKRGNSLEIIKDWSSKLPGAVARIAGLLHFTEHGIHATEKRISIDTILSAISIGKYFREHALSAFFLMQEDSKFEDAKRILEYLKEKKTERFKGRDIISNIYSFKDMVQVISGINILIERDYIRKVEMTSHTNHKKGRPESVLYEVNPKIYI